MPFNPSNGTKNKKRVFMSRSNLIRPDYKENFVTLEALDGIYDPGTGGSLDPPIFVQERQQQTRNEGSLLSSG